MDTADARARRAADRSTNLRANAAGSAMLTRVNMNLSEGETIISRGRPSWRAILGFYLKGVVIADHPRDHRQAGLQHSRSPSSCSWSSR